VLGGQSQKAKLIDAKAHVTPRPFFGEVRHGRKKEKKRKRASWGRPRRRLEVGVDAGQARPSPIAIA